ncbi:rhamnan synthesis F family protein [Kozakia baliensis]|uniref:rhamnan synthesis F family protein n=1 Tax=Kozakia baliensis TaxID=153496 RepID=UPI00087D600A|nr:rhamnan synthesis F family protein [Kozakia baliensis]AOX20692.1 hypothetical protein A0U90_10810 [Kozakia baliensis]
MAERICLFAHYDPAGKIAPHTRHYLRQIAQCGFTIHIAVSGHPTFETDALEALHEGLEDLPLHFYPRVNNGLDFGAWQFLLHRGCAETAQEILFTNDSVFGPLAPLPPLMDDMRRQNYDVWGMVQSHAVTPHLQSWFVVMTAEALAHPAIQRVLNQPFSDMSKPEIILHGELGMGLALAATKLKVGASWRNERRIDKLLGLNPMHLEWRGVIASGRAPFIKTELLRDNPSAVWSVGTWREAIPDPHFFEPAWIEAYLAANPRRANTAPINWRGRLLHALCAEDRWGMLKHTLRIPFDRRHS